MTCDHVGLYRSEKLSVKEVPIILSYFRTLNFLNPLALIDDPEVFLQKVLTECANRTCIGFTGRPCANKVWAGCLRCATHQKMWEKQQQKCA